jgi:DNA-binding ferritin-like protein (Dps family)
VTEDELSDWRSFPTTRAVLEALKAQIDNNKRDIQEAMWATGQDTPERLYYQAMAQCVEFIEQATVEAVNDSKYERDHAN